MKITTAVSLTITILVTIATNTTSAVDHFSVDGYVINCDGKTYRAVNGTRRLYPTDDIAASCGTASMSNRGNATTSQ